MVIIRTHLIDASALIKLVIDEDGSETIRKYFGVGSVFWGGWSVRGGEVRRSLLSPNVRIESFAKVEDSILLEGVRVGEHARIRRAIIDKESEIPPGMQIGYNMEEDTKRFTVTESGIVVVPKGFRAR